MEQHPIPQQISAYQFRLVGDMTLKQFSQLAAGALISLLFYASPLNPLIKWPLIIVSFLFGVALAFLPIEDRPLSTWIVIFFRSIYSPTVFIWNKTKTAPQFFQPEKMVQKEGVVSAQIQVRPATVEVPTTPVVHTEAESKLEEKEKTILTQVAQHLISPGSTVFIEAAPLYSSNQPVQHKVVPVPNVQTPTVDHRQTAAPQIQQPSSNPQPFSTEKTPEVFTPSTTTAAQTAKFSEEVMPPIPPTRPNLIVGQVLDSEGKIIEGAILEIRDTEQRPVRALRTNKLGHFMIVTPLLDGKYEIITEKEGLNFAPISFSAEDKIIPPIAIWAKK